MQHNKGVCHTVEFKPLKVFKKLSKKLKLNTKEIKVVKNKKKERADIFLWALCILILFQIPCHSSKLLIDIEGNIYLVGTYLQTKQYYDMDILL